MRAVRLAVIASLSVVAARPLQAQIAESLKSLLSRASYMNFYYAGTVVGDRDMKVADGDVANGVGFELAFGIPGGNSVKRTLPAVAGSAPGSSCAARFARRELRQGEYCADTTAAKVTRTRAPGATTYEEELDIKPFEWTTQTITFDVGVSFSQLGAFVPMAAVDGRASIRELPAVSVYATFDDIPVFRSMNSAPYLGARSGFVTLHNARMYDSLTTKFSAETIQVGPVAGIIGAVLGMELFAEGAWLLRDFKSVDYETAKAIPATWRRRIDLSGFNFAVGIQFPFGKS